MKNKAVKRVVTCLLVICLAGGIYFGIRIYQEMEPIIVSERYYKNAKEAVFVGEGSKNLQFEKSKQAHEGGVAWIQSIGTAIDYPVMQAKDNQYYLNHLPDGTVNEIGAIFLDYRNSPDFTEDVSVLYGHHITMDRMFSPLSHYKEQAYYDEHKVLTLYIPDKIYDVELFAGTILSGGEQGFPLSFRSPKEKAEWIKELKAKSTFHSDVNPSKKEKILVLCTCSYEFDNARYAVYGRLVERTDTKTESKK